MDQPPQTPPEKPKKDESHKTRSALPLIIALLIIILGLVGVLVWCLFFKDHATTSATTAATSHASSSSSSSSSSTATAAAGPCAGGAANTAPAGFTFYENTSLGFKFAYPSSWGSVTVATTPMGGVGGHYIDGHFSANTNASFGGNATDYIVQGRDGMPTDNPGYLQAGNKFYTVQIWTFRAGGGTPDEPKYDLYPIEETSTLKAGCNAKGLVTQYPFAELTGYSYDVARFNLQPTNAYYGVNFVLKNPTAAGRADLDKLIATFQLIP